MNELPGAAHERARARTPADKAAECRNGAHSHLMPALEPGTSPATEKESAGARRATNLGELHAALPPINRILDRLGKIKRKYGFDFDEVIIIAACGAINFAGAKQDMPFAQPANISSIAGYIRVPRETVRRKLQKIESKGFVQRYSGGYLINSVSDWLSLVDLLTPERGR